MFNFNESELKTKEEKYLFSTEAKYNPSIEQLTLWRQIRTATSKNNRFGYKKITHEEAGERLNKDRSTITKYLKRLREYEMYFSIYYWRLLKYSLEKLYSKEELAKVLKQFPTEIDLELELCKNFEAEENFPVEYGKTTEELEKSEKSDCEKG